SVCPLKFEEAFAVVSEYLNPLGCARRVPMCMVCAWRIF
ncbi:MAG: hypothetical protein ACI9A2_001614, partial [Halioglobus sp.]